MSHNIEITEAGASFFSVKELPWHKLGKVLENPPTSEEAIKYANLDYTVEKGHLTSGSILLPENIMCTYRTDNNKFLGLVSDSYKILQNTEAFQFFDDIVGQGEAIYETAGVLGKGERIFISAIMPDYIEINGVPGSEVQKYLLLTSAHDGSSSVKILFTPIRVVCNNTLSLALEGGRGIINIPHKGKLKERMAEASNLLGIINSFSENIKEASEYAAQVYLDKDEITEIVQRTFIPQEQLEEFIKDPKTPQVSSYRRNLISNVLLYHQTGPGQEGIERSAFGVMNAFTGYFQNAVEYKTDEDAFKKVALQENNHYLKKAQAIISQYL